MSKQCEMCQEHVATMAIDLNTDEEHRVVFWYVCDACAQAVQE
jgi:protein-arginine kinase activator protein McsA